MGVMSGPLEAEQKSPRGKDVQRPRAHWGALDGCLATKRLMSENPTQESLQLAATGLGGKAVDKGPPSSLEKALADQEEAWGLGLVAWEPLRFQRDEAISSPGPWAAR